MNDFVISLDQIRPKDTARVGGKAASLSRLVRAGFPVPSGMCVTTDAFGLALDDKRQQIERIISENDLLNPTQAQTASDQIVEILADLEVPESIHSMLTDMIEGKTVAVRSSATAEDQTDASYAGQYATILGVRGIDAVQEAIINCWRSFYEPQALVARAAHNSLGKEEAMAVIIQAMVDAECSGVCFSIDPVQQRRDLSVINAAWGLGLGVVDGQVVTDTMWLRRPSLEIDRREIPEKHAQIILAPDGGVQTTDILDERRKASCLPEAWARRIAQFGLAAEALSGKPQDVEWVIANQQLWILQSRPITALSPELAQTPRFPIKQKIEHFWSLMDEYGIDRGPLLPLEQDAILVAESIREEACRFMGVDRNQETHFFNGRAYNRPLPMNSSDGDRRIRGQAIKDLNDRLHEQRLTAWDYWGPEIIRTTERLRAFDPTSADGKALAEHLENAMAARRRHAMLHPICSFNPHPAYFQALEKITGQSDNKALGYRLLEGEETPLTQLVDRLYELAQSAAPSVQALIRNPPDDFLDQLKAMPEAEIFLKHLEDILLIYGERTGDGWGSEVTILNPTWREQPQEIFRLLVFYFNAQIESPASVRMQNQRERETLVESLCRDCEDHTVVAEFRRELAHARKVAAVLEIHNHYIDQMATGQLRQAVMMAAQWLVKQGVLSQVDGIFWLYFDEILAALRSPISYSHEIVDRQAQHRKWQKMEAPPFLGIPNGTLPERPPWQDDTTPANKTRDGFISGQGASPGQKQGRARIMTDNIDQLAPGDILVAKNVGPRWTPIFPILGGLVLDHGALGQHAAAIAREYNIPAVIGTRFATQCIPEGVQISVDGTNGAVEILRPGS
jgi:rifampicin phosphotransferase